MRDPYQILKSPHVTEKTMQASALDKYYFIVAPDANKIEIREAVEKIFNVKVLNVNTINVRGKKRRRGRAPQGETAGFKKACITVAPGSRIEIFERA